MAHYNLWLELNRSATGLGFDVQKEVLVMNGGKQKIAVCKIESF